ncbi:hypothetical protein ABTX60_01705 [Streptomyces sp. NPDC126510]|uniref:hypothetical protein n=1 Tax=Streptomyces sp. NPDC126510 TaxID=3155317 RepID=UPI00331C26EF
MAENERLRLAIIIGSIRKGRFGHVAANWPASRARLRPDFDVHVIDLATAWLPDVMSTGGSVIRRDVHPQRFHRDIQGFSPHAPADAGVGIELQGRALGGPNPGTVFL